MQSLPLSARSCLYFLWPSCHVDWIHTKRTWLPFKEGLEFLLKPSILWPSNPAVIWHLPTWTEMCVHIRTWWFRADFHYCQNSTQNLQWINNLWCIQRGEQSSLKKKKKNQNQKQNQNDQVVEIQQGTLSDVKCRSQFKNVACFASRLIPTIWHSEKDKTVGH